MNSFSLFATTPKRKSTVSNVFFWFVALVVASAPFSGRAAAPPVINAPFTFKIPENPLPGALIGTISATDPDAGDTLTYIIVNHSLPVDDDGVPIDPRQNPSNIFVLNSANGQLRVSTLLTTSEINKILDYDLERNPSTTNLVPYVIEVKVQDNHGSNTLADISIDLSDVNEPPVVTQPEPAFVDEHSNATVATISAVDPESVGSSKLTFTLKSGHLINSVPVFSINSSSGQITVADPSLLDYESPDIVNHQFTIVVEVKDDATPAHTSEATLIVNVNNVVPIIQTKTLNVKGNAPADSVVGVLTVPNPDGGTLSFTVQKFTINSQAVASPATLFSVDPDGTVILKKDAATIFAGLDSKQVPDAQLTLAVTNSPAGDGNTNTIKITRESLPGGSPFMLNVNELVGSISGPNGNRGEPIQDLANGPNGEIVTVGSINGSGFLNIYPGNVGLPTNIVFAAGNFTPVSVVVDPEDASIYVGGMLGANVLNEYAQLMNGSVPLPGGVEEPPLQLQPKEAVVYKYSLQGELLITNSFWKGRDGIITDMTIANGNLYVCGGVRNMMINYYAWPLTYQPLFVRFNSNLAREAVKVTDPHKPGDQTRDGLGYGDHFAIHTAIAVSPSGDVYCGGYGIEWGDRYNAESSDASGYIVRYRLVSTNTLGTNSILFPFFPFLFFGPQYGDLFDFPNDSTVSQNETWISDKDQNNWGWIPRPNPDLGIRPYNFTFVKDLSFVTSGGQSTLYALQEYRKRGLPFNGMYWKGQTQPPPNTPAGNGYDNEHTTPAIDGPNGGQQAVAVKVARFTPDLYSDTGTASAVIHPEQPRAAAFQNGVLKTYDVRAGSLSADPDGNIYVTGMIPAELTTKLGAEPKTPLQDRFFVAKYKSDLQLSWVESFDDGAYQPIIGPWLNFEHHHPHELNAKNPLNGMGAPGAPLVSPLLAEWSKERNALLLGGNFKGGELILTRGENTANEQVNRVSASSNTTETGFLTFITAGQEFVGSSGVLIESVVETDGRPVGDSKLIRPFVGSKIARPGQIITVEAPRTMYAKRVYVGTNYTESYLGTFNSPPTEDVIRDEADTRYVLTGITVDNQEFHADLTSYTFAFENDVTVTLHWRAEHAVTINSALEDTTDGDLGLASTASGNPEPSVQKHWFPENGIVTAFVDGVVSDLVNFGTRYITTGYEALGSSRTDGGTNDLFKPPQKVAFSKIDVRQQVPQFVVTGPAKINYRWGIQHRIQVSTSSSDSQDLPLIDADAPAIDGQGSKEFWYLRGTALKVLARDRTANATLNGWLIATGIPGVATSSDRISNATQYSVSGVNYHGFALSSLNAPIIISWDYGDAIFHEDVGIGNAVQFVFPPEDIGFDVTKVESSPGVKRAPNSIRVVEGPPGSTGADMLEWDDVAKKAYPTRPGIFFLEWNQAGSTKKTIVQVTSGFGGDVIANRDPIVTFPGAKRHYRHLSHPDMPLVALDNNLKDTNAFLSLKYTESDATVAEKSFTAQRPGRHVLLFSQSAPGVEAVGDRTRETLLVRVVETRRWNAVYEASANSERVVKGAWTDIVGSAMLQAPATPVTIGQRLAGPLDKAGIRTAFIVSPRAPYNVNLYDRTKVAEAGPIFPINQQFTPTDNEDDLTVVWYEHSETPGTIPDDILWPYQSVKYNTAWPTTSALTTGPGGAQPVDRIVVASRLGSEGRNERDINQPFFDRKRYDQVRIYEQPDREKAGYNPNEEHALIAPSFKYLDQANPPPTAYALRNDLNITTQGTTYTSDPFVLVEYFDRGTNGAGGEFKMAVYKIELEDDRPSLNPYVFPEVGSLADLTDLPLLAGRLTQLERPVDTWLLSQLSPATTDALAEYSETVTNANPVPLQEAFQVDLKRILAGPSIYDAQRFTGVALRSQTQNLLSQNPTLDRLVRLNRLLLEDAYPLELSRNQREFPYTFNYKMKAGEPVQPPYPLGLVIGLTPCEETRGESDSPSRVYWEDVNNQPWAVSAGKLRSFPFYPQAVNFWNGEGTDAVAPGTCVAFLTAGPIFVTGTNASPTFAAGNQFTINTTTVTISGTDANALVLAVNTAAIEVDAIKLFGGEVRLRSKNGLEFNVTDGAGSPLVKAGILSKTYRATDGVSYTAEWPDVLPILKVGETLTFAGGEYKADNPGPEQPGLPGVVGWAAGKIIFDSKNPAMNSIGAFDVYAGRLIAPLEDRVVQLNDTDAQALEGIIQPANGLTKVDGTIWKFTGLPASLGKRIFYDSLNNRLGVRGYLNDHTLGDGDLTATPPPVYVLEPDILTGRERDTLLALKGLVGSPAWTTAVTKLYALSRNPEQITKSAPASDPYYVGLETDVQQENNGDKLDDDDKPVTIPFSARHKSSLGPGLALIPSPQMLAPGNSNEVNYLTLAENDDKRVGGPVTLHIVKIEKKHRYRGAIKTILSDNVFDERITLRHTADFGANGDDIVYQWFYREEDGRGAPLPPDPAWKLFTDQSDSSVKGLGQYQITIEGTGGLVLADNLLFTRYRHKDDLPADGPNSVNWTKGSPEKPGSPAKPYGTEWNRDGAEYRDPEAKDLLGKPDTGLKFGGEWAGAANSPTVDKAYRAQLVPGWIKRVLDRINPYEARFSDFRNNDAPATYASFLQQAGQRQEGPVALNPDKDVIENVGLIELYQTILDRGVNLSIGLSSPITTPGINNALLLAATRISDLYMLMGNEAYSDALDPTIGFVSGTDLSGGVDLSGANPGYGSLAPAVFSFQNQMGSLLDEELALLRGVDDTFGRPVYNRLFWNFTKGEGEVAYAMNYNVKDVNQDGFIDENDARVLYPQGHGDAWGHYLTALKSRYALLKHPFFNWQSRSEFYNLLDVVIPVDFLDERKFAEAAAAKAKAGAEIVNMTYRSRYVDDPSGQWQGYTDPVSEREWGVTEWARRAGQGALFDWVTANALIPSKEPDPKKSGIQRVDRTTVSDIASISANLGAVQSTYDSSNGGLNPLGLDSDVVPFDWDPLFPDIGSTAAIGRTPVQGTSHYEQIYERVFSALNNARVAFDYANIRKNALRQVADTVDQFRKDVIEKDRDYRNRLIELFGTPYDGVIGTGKPYPAGYAGPDLSLFMYVDVRGVNTNTVPGPNEQYDARVSGFANDLKNLTGEFRPVLDTEFLDSLTNGLLSWTGVVFSDNSVLDLKLPATAGSYTFQALPEWGTRAAPGRLQQLISEMVQTEADLSYAVSDYDVLINKIENRAELIAAKYGVAQNTLQVKDKLRGTITGLNFLIQTFRATSDSLIFLADLAKNISEATAEGVDLTVGLSFTPFKPLKATFKGFGAGAQQAIRVASLLLSIGANAAEADKERIYLQSDREIVKEGFSYEIREQLRDIEELLINEGATRITVFRLKEQLRNQADQYRAALQEGVRLIQERETFNKNTAAFVQENRYRDVAFRVSRNDALQKYRAAFDLAARYLYMSAKAYDFETNLSPNDRGSAYGFFDQIIRARTLGEMADGIPIHPGGGLAGIAAMMNDNFRAIESQISLNNYQMEFNTFSFREENFGIGRSPGDNNSWRDQLATYRVDNLWDSSEFRRYCRPFAPHSASVPEPGLIIPFSTEIKAGHNFFGKPLLGGHSTYDPTSFSTKIRSASMQFEGYGTGDLTKTPRVYLVPVGMDVMYIPTSRNLETRVWNVVDQKIPPPFKTGIADLADPNFIPVVDSLQGSLGEIRRYSSFRAYASEADAADAWKDMRLVGRSAWNTQWLLFIPGRALLGDAAAGLDQFINDVTDIQLTFETYASSGN